MPELNEPLSERELEILRLVATGAPNKEIARQLVISPNTVKVHLRNVFTKIGVASRTEATLYAVKIGLIQPGAAREVAEEMPGDDSSSGLPGITIEAPAEMGQVSPVLTNTPASENGIEPKAEMPQKRPRIWLVSLIIGLAFLVLIASGVIGARLLVTPTRLPTIISQAATQVTAAPRWLDRAPLPSPRRGMGIVSYENAFYLFGGETSQGVDGATQRYDPAQNNWQPLSNKPTPVTDIQAALLGEKIYIPGGRMANGSTTDRLEVFDPRQGIWESKAALPAPLSAYALVSFEGQLYLFGGKNGDHYSASVYVYNPQENRWTERTAMNAPRAYASAAVSSEKIFVMGGYDGHQALRRNDAYIPTRDESGETPWQTFAPLPQGRYAMGAAPLAGQIYLLGGLGDNNMPVSQVAIQYIVQSDQWAEFDAPPIKVGAYPAWIASGNSLYLIGGETARGLSADTLSYQAIYTISVPILRNDKTP